MGLQVKKVTCVFCKCELVYAEGHLKRLIRHVKFEHGIIFNVKYIMASCFLSESEMDAVTDIVFKKNDLEVTDNVVAGVTLHNNVVREKEKVVDINYNTGATYSKVLDRTNQQNIDEKNGSRYKVAKMDDDQAKKTRSHEEYLGSKHKKARVSSNDRIDGDTSRITTNNEGGKSKTIKSGVNSSELPNPSSHGTNVVSPKASKSKFNCNECDLSYTRKFTLIKHKNEKHGKTTEAFITGDMNTKKAVIESLLSADSDDELNIQEPTKPFCDHCSKTFKLQSHLKLHMKRYHVKKTQNAGNEGGIFVAVEDNDTATKLEMQQAGADPFLTDMREKLMTDLGEDSNQMVFKGVGGNQDEMAHNLVTVSENIVGGQANFFIAVDEALDSDFVIA